MKQLVLTVTLCALAALTLGARAGFAGDAEPDSDSDDLKANHIFGFGADELLKFTYEQNFACIHEPRVDLYPALAALGKVPKSPAHNIFVPTPNHSHIVNDDAVVTKPIW